MAGKARLRPADRRLDVGGGEGLRNAGGGGDAGRLTGWLLAGWLAGWLACWLLCWPALVATGPRPPGVAQSASSPPPPSPGAAASARNSRRPRAGPSNELATLQGGNIRRWREICGRQLTGPADGAQLIGRGTNTAIQLALFVNGVLCGR